MTSAMSARMSKRVTADSKALAARTMVPRFTDEHGSSANSEEAMRMVSPGRQTGRRVGRREAQGLAILKICGWMIVAFIAKLPWTVVLLSPPAQQHLSRQKHQYTRAGAVDKTRCSCHIKCGINRIY